MAGADFHRHRGWFSRRRFLVTVALSAVAGVIAALLPRRRKPQGPSMPNLRTAMSMPGTWA